MPCKWLFICCVAVVSSACGGRTLTRLSDGWTCDGEPVHVPHTWNATDACDGPGETVKLWTGEKGGDSVGGLGYLKKRALYRRSLPSKRKGRRYFLRFEGASVVADVSVGGRFVGSHVGAFTAFAFEVTDFLKTDGESELEVAVDNRWREDTQPMAADYSVYGGLYRNVWLLETDPVCIDPVTDGADGVTVSADPKTGEVTVEVAVLGGTNEVQKFRVENHELWSPESPRLYTRRIAIDQKGSHDAVDIRFGFRTFEFRDGIFHLNGVRRQLRGVNRHQDRAGKGWAVSAADEEEDVRLMKEMGVDALRTAHYPQSRHIYDLCDELGIICWVEYPNVNRLTFSAAFEDGLRRQVREMVAQHRNHPCVAMWGMFNELYNGEAWMKPHARELEAMMTRMRDLIHELDPSRTVVGVMGEAGIPSLNAIPDEYGLNVYPKWYSNLTMREMLAWLFRDSGRRTFSISEYGVGASVKQHGDPATAVPAAGMWHPEEYQAYRMHDNLLEMMREPRVWGTYVWAMFDFGADNRREGDREGINDKGLVTHDRRTKKDAFYLYQANWTKTPTLHLVGQHMTVTTNRTLSVMGFSNVGPVTLRVNGKKLGTKTPDAACGVVWPAVELQAGDNEIALEANGFEDRRRWRRDAGTRVDSLNTNLTALVCMDRVERALLCRAENAADDRNGILRTITEMDRWFSPADGCFPRAPDWMLDGVRGDGLERIRNLDYAYARLLRFAGVLYGLPSLAARGRTLEEGIVRAHGGLPDFRAADAVPEEVRAYDALMDENRRDLGATVRPGDMSGSPFWNENARVFIYAPSFAFGRRTGAAVLLRSG